MKLLNGMIAIALFAASAPAATYDFNNCIDGNLNGQDGWTSNGMDVRPNPSGGAPHPGAGLCATTYGGTSNYYATRPNNNDWSYDISTPLPFFVQADMVTDYSVSGYYGHGKVYLTSSLTGRKIGMGIEVLPWYYSPLISNALGTETNSNSLQRPTARNQIFSIRMEVDPAGHAGQGAATLLLARTWLGEDFAPVASLENVNLQLATTGTSPALFDGLRMEIKTRLVAIDNITVGLIPEPATLTLLLIGTLTLRRKLRT